jgi:uncharacterized integral membrane protein
MRLFTWLLRAFVFFTLFAFALNNQQAVTVRWFFGLDWQAPLVIVVLLAFGMGCAVGVLAMVPAWWRQRRARQVGPTAAATTSASPDGSMPGSVDAAPASVGRVDAR